MRTGQLTSPITEASSTIPAMARYGSHSSPEPDGIHSWTAPGCSRPTGATDGFRRTHGAGRHITMAHGCSCLDVVGHGSPEVSGAPGMVSPSWQTSRVGT